MVQKLLERDNLFHSRSYIYILMRELGNGYITIDGTLVTKKEWNDNKYHRLEVIMPNQYNEI